MAVRTENSIIIAGALKLDFGYKGSDVERDLGEVLGVPSTEGWEVLDKKGDLHLVHYKDEAKYDLGHLRGAIVNLKTKRVVTPSFGYTSAAVCPELPQPVDGSLHFVDENGVEHKFDADKVQIKRAFEGVGLRLMRVNGEFIVATFRKLNTERSHWGGLNFREAYFAAGGWTEDQLFDVSKPHSSTVHSVIVVHSGLQVGSKQVINKPFLVHVGTQEMDLGFPADEVTVGKNISGSPEMPAAVDSSFVHTPLNLTVEEANNHLRFGYHGPQEFYDYRQYTGESLILCQREGEHVHTLRVNSPSFDWRLKLRFNNPNIRNQFYHLTTRVSRPFDENNFHQFLSAFVPYTRMSKAKLEEALKQGPLAQFDLSPQTVSPQNYPTLEDRVFVVFMNFLISLPPSVQQEHLNLFENYIQDRAALSGWLFSLHSQNQNLATLEAPDSVKRVLATARSATADEVRKSRGDYDKILKTKIKSVLERESGKNLYALVREMKKPPPQ